ncbi:MAG: hypothetical protein KatS3mg128_0821 [Silanimonas sp.]|nr:MAG: hypothetical protein KatS3mg127_1977 [Silanimonas sp.]GIX39772.1 MAG: hypothetical protein KatS3mg128_0821 [Silanimonas sp.]
MSDAHERHRLQSLLDAMPPVAAMGIRLARLDAAGLRLEAPLARNVNDKGCAFGGSLASLLTLAAWGVLESRLRQAGIEAEVYVARSELEYLSPLYEDLAAEAPPPEASAFSALLEKLRARGRGGIVLTAEARDAEGRVAARLQGRYAAVLRR